MPPTATPSSTPEPTPSATPTPTATPAPTATSGEPFPFNRFATTTETGKARHSRLRLLGYI